jgi:hypothetical protein
MARQRRRRRLAFNRTSRRQRSPRPPRRGDHGVAGLTLAAAIAAAAFSGWAGWSSSRAADGWQHALRQEVQWSAAAVEDIRFVYADQAPVVLAADLADARAVALRAAAEHSSGTSAEVAAAEARIEAELAFRLRQHRLRHLRLDEQHERDYRRPDGTFDLVRRLADERSQHASLVGIDPEHAQQAGDDANRQASMAAVAALPLAGAFLIGAGVVARRRRRGPARPPRTVLAAGYGLLAVAIVLALIGVVA